MIILFRQSLTNTIKDVELYIEEVHNNLNEDGKMLTEITSPLIIILAFGLVIYFIVIFKPNLPKPKYENHFPGGKSFPEDMFKRFEGMRKENNPDGEPIGISNGRCQFCGSGNIDKKFKSTSPFNLEKKFIKNCNGCNMVIASM